jgi:hypothetical protein
MPHIILLQLCATHNGNIFDRTNAPVGLSWLFRALSLNLAPGKLETPHTPLRQSNPLTPIKRDCKKEDILKIFSSSPAKNDVGGNLYPSYIHIPMPVPFWYVFDV